MATTQARPNLNHVVSFPRNSSSNDGSVAADISTLPLTSSSRPHSSASSTISQVQGHTASSAPVQNASPPDTTTLPPPSSVTQQISALAAESLIDKWWLFEAFALLVSLGSLMSLSAVFVHYDGKPLSKWTSPISLNALVAILGAIARSSLTLPLGHALQQWKWMRLRKSDRPLNSLQHFDDAAKGPWGSLMLLCRPRYFSFASFGALVIAIALSFEPFTQQAVVFISRNTAVGQAILPRSSFYNVANDASSNYLAAMKMAVYDNLLGLGTSALSTIPVTCPTGNCVWDEYTSIGVCAQCIDISKRIWVSNGAEFCTKDLSNCTIAIRTPNNAALIEIFEDQGTVMNVSTVGQSTGLLGGYSFTSLANVTMIAVLGLGNYTATECILYGCAKKYSATVRDGALSENITKTYWNTTRPLGVLSIDDNDNRLSGVAANISTTLPSSDLLIGEDQIFNFDFERFWWMMSYLRSTLLGSVWGVAGNDNIFDYNVLSGRDVSDQMLALWQNGPLNFAASIDQLASGLTDYMRLANSGNKSDARAVGVALGGELYIHVRWPWLILPYSLELIAYLFVLGTVMVARRSNVPLWKSSSLIVWYHHMTGSQSPSSSSSPTTFSSRTMDYLAARTQIQLVGMVDNLELTQTSSPALPAVTARDTSKLSRLRRAATRIPETITG